MDTITIRVSEEDKELFKKVSKEKELTLSDWARETLIESIEAEYDINIVKEYIENKENIKFFTADEAEKELGL